METTILRLRRAIMVIVVTIVRIAKHSKIIKLILEEKKIILGIWVMEVPNLVQNLGLHLTEVN